MSIIKDNVRDCFKIIDSYCDIIKKSEKTINHLEKVSDSFSHEFISTHNVDVDVHFAANVIRTTINALRDIIDYSNKAIIILERIAHCKCYSGKEKEYNEPGERYV